MESALAAGEGRTVEPPPLGASLEIPERQMCARPEWELDDTEVLFSAPASVVALFRTAILAFAASAHSLTGGLERLLRPITWELGVRAGRKPLLRLEGNRYVS